MNARKHGYQIGILMGMAVLAAGTAAWADIRPVQADDIILGTATSGTSLYQVRTATSISPTQIGDWGPAVPSAEYLSLDNLNGVPHNAQGNLLAMTYSGVLYSASTSSAVAPATSPASSQIFNIQDTAGNAALPGYSALTPAQTSSAMGGLAVSPNNNMIAVTGYTSGSLYVYGYTAGNGSTTAGSITSVAATSGTSVNLYGGSATINPQWIDNSHVVAVDSIGIIHLTTITGSGAGITFTDVKETNALPLTASSFSYTALAYNPTISPYLFCAVSGYNAGTVNEICVIDPTNNYSILKTVNYSFSLQTTRGIALDSAGDLIISQYSGIQNGGGTTVSKLPGFASNYASFSNDGYATSTNPYGIINLGKFGSANSYNSVEVAGGTPATPNPSFTWSNGGATAVDASGTWNATTTFVGGAWADGANPNNSAVFGAGTGTGAGACTIDLNGGTRTVASITFAANSANYHLTNGTLVVLGDTNADGIDVNTTATIDANLQMTGPVKIASGQTLTINGEVSGSALIIAGADSSATVLLTNTLNSQNGTSLVGGRLSISDERVLGATTGAFQIGNATLQFAAGFTTSTRDVTFIGLGTLDTSGHDVIMTGQLSGSAGFNKISGGTLNLTANPTTGVTDFGGPVNVLGGTIHVTGYDGTDTSGNGTYVSPSASSSPPTTVTSLGYAKVNIKSGGTVYLDGVASNVTAGTAYSVDNAAFTLYDGGTLKVSAPAGGALFKSTLSVARATYTATDGSGNPVYPSAPSNTTLQTTSASDVLTITSAVQSWSIDTVYPYGYVGDSMSNLHVAGPGRVVLQSGGVSAAATFSGSWVMDAGSGVLQIGPVFPKSVADSGKHTITPGPLGEPLNALGFKDPVGGTGAGDPDSPNTITLNGGILALAVDAPNTNPNITSTPANPTPNYLRNPIILAGGALAATGSEVTYNTANKQAVQGVADGISVVARFGGDFTVQDGAISKILTYNPVVTTDTGFAAGGREVDLVGGTRDITQNGGNSTLTYATNWYGILQVDAGGQTGGKFVLNRNVAAAGSYHPGTVGSVTVGSNAKLQVLSGAAAELDGNVDVFTDSTDNTKHVALQIDSGGSFTVGALATTTVKSITGGGNLTVAGALAVQVQPDAATRHLNPVVVGTLAVTGTLNLTNNDMVVKGGANNTADGLRQLLLAGKITSPGAAAANLGLGYLTGSSYIAMHGNQFDGVTVNPSDLVVKYTYLGDVNLDGKIDASDFAQLDASYLKHLSSGATWLDGDTNNDGVINAQDFINMDTAFTHQSGGIMANDPYLAQNAAMLGMSLTDYSGLVADQVAAGSAVPEPASLALLGLGAVALLRRRR